MRHAEAHQAGMGEKDYDRELSNRGFQDAIHTGMRLNAYIVRKVDRIVASSARRTSETARLVAERLLMYEENIQLSDLLYQPSMNDLLRIINELPPSEETVVMIGHNPYLSYLAEYLSGADAMLGTAQAAVIRFPEGFSWEEVGQNSGRLDIIVHPEGE